jgi:SAM-dependent methyltransferase
MSTDSQWLAAMPQAYDDCLGPALFAPFARHVAGIAAALRPSSVLELAAGTGILTAELVCVLPDARITATDLNAAMVSWGASHVPGPAWQQADAQQLELADASFDLVVCQFGVMFFPDKSAAFAEAARVLAPGGKLLFTVWDAVETSDFPAAMVHSLASVLPEDSPDFIVRVPHGYCDADQIGADLQAGGLVVDALDRTVLRGRSTAQALANGFCRGTPLRFALQERGSLEHLVATLEEQLIARLGTGPVDGDLAAFVVTASRPAEHGHRR